MSYSVYCLVFWCWLACCIINLMWLCVPCDMFMTLADCTYKPISSG